MIDPDWTEELDEAFNMIEKQSNLGKQILSSLPKQEPVIDKAAAIRIATALGWEPKREWVGLTPTQIKLLWEGVQEEAIKSGDSLNWVFYTHINEALKEKNT